MKKHINSSFAVIISLSIIMVISCETRLSDKLPEETIDYNLPEDLPSNASDSDLAMFAWKSFFALNWQASWELDAKRTVPDTSWDFKNSGTQPDLAVWETYIHRIELRPASGIRSRDFSSGSPYYSFIDSNKIDFSNVNMSNYWCVLDEDNEIGSCYLFSHKNQNQVLYMAKTNLVEYNYLKKNFPTDAQLYKAKDSIANLPINARYNYLKNLTKKGMCSNDSLVISLPCKGGKTNEGAIEIKLAFRKLNPLKEDTSRFITKKVIVFKQDSTGKHVLRAQVQTFGLIGMHIIRKTPNYPTFIFTSFEQVDVRNANMQTIGIDDGGIEVDSMTYPNVDPHRLNPVIERVIPEAIQQVNQQVKAAILSLNPKSKWQYYQLIGVQATPRDYADRNSDNNFFMANYVIESDLLLTNFHGSFVDPFNSSIQNLVADGKTYNMGGCKGCHGQAQVTFGTDFSFLLDSGNNKPVILPDSLINYQQGLLISNPSSNAQGILSSFKKFNNAKRK